MTTWVMPGLRGSRDDCCTRRAARAGWRSALIARSAAMPGCADRIEGGIGPACERFGGTAAVAECGGRNQVEDSFRDPQLIDRQRREHGIERCTLALWRNDFRHRRRIRSGGSPYRVSEVPRRQVISPPPAADSGDEDRAAGVAARARTSGVPTGILRIPNVDSPIRRTSISCARVAIGSLPLSQRLASGCAELAGRASESVT